MSRSRAEISFESDAIARMMRAAGLPVEEDHLDDLAELLEVAAEAARHLDEAAARIPLGEALVEFDPSWRVSER